MVIILANNETKQWIFLKIEIAEENTTKQFKKGCQIANFRKESDIFHFFRGTINTAILTNIVSIFIVLSFVILFL